MALVAVLTQLPCWSNVYINRGGTSTNRVLCWIWEPRYDINHTWGNLRRLKFYRVCRSQSSTQFSFKSRPIQLTISDYSENCILLSSSANSNVLSFMTENSYETCHGILTRAQYTGVRILVRRHLHFEATPRLPSVRHLTCSAMLSGYPVCSSTREASIVFRRCRPPFLLCFVISNMCKKPLMDKEVSKKTHLMWSCTCWWPSMNWDICRQNYAEVLAPNMFTAGIWMFIWMGVQPI